MFGKTALASSVFLILCCAIKYVQIVQNWIFANNSGKPFIRIKFYTRIGLCRQNSNLTCSNFGELGQGAQNGGEKVNVFETGTMMSFFFVTGQISMKFWGKRHSVYFIET